MEKITTPEAMTTSSEILEKLRVKHMDNEFRWTPKGFTTPNGKTYRPEDLEIVRTLRFEGESDPSDMEILYIMKTNDGLFGYSLDAYGAKAATTTKIGTIIFSRRKPQPGNKNNLLFPS